MAIRFLAVRPRVPVSLIFFLLGVTAGVWAARIPGVVGPLHLSPGILGLVLFGPALGSVVAIPLAGAALATFPARRIIQLGMVPAGALLPVATIAASAWQLFVILAAWGAGVGTVDVAMNTAGMTVQNRLARRVMSTFHGWFSAGALAGAGLSALAAAVNVSARTNFVAAAVVVVPVGMISAEALEEGTPDAEGEAQGPSSRRPRWSWPLAALALMAFASFMSEGSADSWSAVYLHFSLGASAGLAAVAYAAFSLAMTGGRFAGDTLANSLGPVRLIRMATAVAAIIFAAALVVGTAWFALFGFAALGLGLSFVVPIVIAAASGLGEPPGPNVAFVTSAGYLGMLTGPPLIGLVASSFSLPAALGIIAVLTGMLAVLAGNVRPTIRTRPDKLGSNAPDIDSAVRRDDTGASGGSDNPSDDPSCGPPRN